MKKVYAVDSIAGLGEWLKGRIILIKTISDPAEAANAAVDLLDELDNKISEFKAGIRARIDEITEMQKRITLPSPPDVRIVTPTTVTSLAILNELDIELTRLLEGGARGADAVSSDPKHELERLFGKSSPASISVLSSYYMGGNDACIRKVKVLDENFKEQAKAMGMKDNDLVLITTKMEKVEGSPIKFLLDRIKKKKGKK